MAIAGDLVEVILYVQDMNRQVGFYRDVLGLHVKQPQGVQDYGPVFWVELDTGSCSLALHAGGQGRQGADAPKIVFQVDDVAQARASLADQGVPMGEIRSPAPGVEVCDGVDPEGNGFSIESRA